MGRAKLLVCGGSNFLPAEHLALWQACAAEGNVTKGRRIMSALMPLMRVLDQGGKFIQTDQARGRDDGQFRRPATEGAEQGRQASA